jgi:NAD(P)-dependent dehydrogenase (short-subunit alcohol dehydrogenase family)
LFKSIDQQRKPEISVFSSHRKVLMTTERTVIITGAYGAIGEAISHGMAKLGYVVTMAGRNQDALMRAADRVRSRSANPHIHAAVVDLSDKNSIIQFASRWNGPLHVLINNAATAPGNRSETPEGIEVQWATNVLGYFRMILFFNGFMKGQKDARIVNVASYWAGGLDLKDPEFKARPYDNDLAYRQSKQANRMMSAAFSRQIAPAGISVNACHPGDVNSKLSNSLGFGGHESPGEGAETPLWLATSPSQEGITGKYFEHLQECPCTFSQDKAASDKLMQLCSSY